jgi:hypothetical protein
VTVLRPQEDKFMALSEKLRASVKQVLLLTWDPIGVKDIEEARDEYDAYVSPIVRSILERRAATELRDQLLAFETDRMGLEGDEGRASSVAAELVGLQKRD